MNEIEIQILQILKTGKGNFINNFKSINLTTQNISTQLLKAIYKNYSPLKSEQSYVQKKKKKKDVF